MRSFDNRRVERQSIEHIIGCTNTIREFQKTVDKTALVDSTHEGLDSRYHEWNQRDHLRLAFFW